MTKKDKSMDEEEKNVSEFWFDRRQNSGEKKDPPICPESWYGRGQNSSEKEKPSCMS